MDLPVLFYIEEKITMLHLYVFYLFYWRGCTEFPVFLYCCAADVGLNTADIEADSSWSETHLARETKVVPI